MPASLNCANSSVQEVLSFASQLRADGRLFDDENEEPESDRTFNQEHRLPAGNRLVGVDHLSTAP